MGTQCEGKYLQGKYLRVNISTQNVDVFFYIYLYTYKYKVRLGA